MACEFDSLGHTWIVNGKKVTPMYDEDVVGLIRENCGDDCANYIRMVMSPDYQHDKLYELTDDEILNNEICSGECDKVQRTQEHYEDILQEIKELEYEVYNKIMEGYTIGGKRTKKEQFALDKMIAIHNLIQKNT